MILFRNIFLLFFILLNAIGFSQKNSIRLRMTTLNFADKERKVVEASNPDIFNSYGYENFFKVKEGQFSIFYYRSKKSYLLYLGFGYRYSDVYFEDNYHIPNKYSKVDDRFYNAFIYNLGMGKSFRFGKENRFEFQANIGMQLIRFSPNEFKFIDFQYDGFERVEYKLILTYIVPSSSQVGLTLEPNIYYNIYNNFYLGLSFNVWLSWDFIIGDEIDLKEIYDINGKLISDRKYIVKQTYTSSSVGTWDYISVMYRF